jgi:hypothetical protein
MIWRLFPFVLAAILVAGILVSDLLASRLDHTTKGRLTGDDPKEIFPKGSERFAVMGENKTIRFLSPEKALMMKKLNPNLFEERALDIIFLKEAPDLKKLPPLATPKLSR